MLQTDIIYPKSDTLRKYVKYFLFLKNNDTTYCKEHTSFPNTNHCLGLHKGNKVLSDSDGAYYLEKSSTYHSYITGIYHHPISFKMSGVFDEICIDFEPLGLEAFCNDKVSVHKFLNNAIETFFTPDWQNIYDIAFEYEHSKERAKALEDFFLRKLSFGSEKSTFIPFNQIKANHVSELTNLFNLRYRSVHRIYSKSLGISPKDFLKIVRFRNSIHCLSQSQDQIDTAYQAGYSDQSHFIREFKNYTELTPRKFMGIVDSINNDVWLSVK